MSVNCGNKIELSFSVNYVGGFLLRQSHMKHEGLVRTLQSFADNQVQISTVVTQQINKYLRKVHPEIEHRYDVWYISKGT